MRPATTCQLIGLFASVRADKDICARPLGSPANWRIASAGADASSGGIGKDGARVRRTAVRDDAWCTDAERLVDLYARLTSC